MGDALLGGLIFIVVVLVILFSIASSAVKIVQEYERGVIFRLGRLVGREGRASSSSYLSWTAW